MDHIALMRKERGFDLKANIDKYSELLTEIYDSIIKIINK